MTDISGKFPLGRRPFWTGKKGLQGGIPEAAYRRVLLVNPPQETIGGEFMMDDMPLRLEYIAASIRKHVEFVEVLDLTRDKRPLSLFLQKARPDLVGFTINYMSSHVNALKLARVAKQFGADTVVGGYQATALADEFAAHPDVDYVVRGEGEQTALELVQGVVPVQEILGLSFSRSGRVVHNEARPPVEDLDSLPFPERHLRKAPYELLFTDLEGGASTGYDMIITSRGCWGRCKFCTEPMMSGGRQRYRRPEKVIEEIEEIVKFHRRKRRIRLVIADPNFGGRPRVAEELCDQLISYRKRCPIELHLFTTVRTSTVSNNPTLVRKMARAGVDYVFVGMESPHTQELRAIGKRGESQEKQEKAVRLLHESGISIMSCFLLGLPDQTEEDVWDMFDYARKLNLKDGYFSVMCPLPGSELYREALEEGRLLETDSTKYKLFDMLLKHDHMTSAKVSELCVRCNAKWLNDLFLTQEHRRWAANGEKKKKLFDYAVKFNVLVGFFAAFGSTVTGMYADIDPSNFVRDLPNPELRKFTEEKGMHRFIEMGRFLNILGRQKIQVSVEPGSDGRDAVSWVIRTNAKEVEYVDAIRGRTQNNTISINLSMTEGSLTPSAIVGRILKDNADLRSRINLARLAAAVGSEVASGYAERVFEAARGRFQSLIWPFLSSKIA
jgi:anaerobic magnesium-protoporphyrin IX monomethyl ester cyclase